MKKIIILMFAILLVASGSAFAIIAGSKHDLSATGGGNNLSACQYCHTPHHASTDTDGTLPLWNRALPDFSSGYTLYGSTGAVGGVTIAGSTVNAPGKHSLTCLSCHDGVSVYGDVIVGGSALTSVTMGTTSEKAIGQQLATTHPIGVAWAAGGLAGLADATAIDPYRLYNVGAGDDRIECGSCHDPHADDYTANTDFSPFLRGNKSTMCTTCHSAK